MAQRPEKINCMEESIDPKLTDLGFRKDYIKAIVLMLHRLEGRAAQFQGAHSL